MRRHFSTGTRLLGAVLAGALAFALASCGGSGGGAGSGDGGQSAGSGPDTTVGPLPIPASYVRDPGPEGVQRTLTLRADGIFFERRRATVLGEPESEHDWGRWKFSDDGRRVVLYGGGEEPVQLAIAPPDTLLPLDGNGRLTATSREQALRRADLFDPIRDQLVLLGEMIYQADAATFTECQMRQPFPIAMELDYAALESAYLTHRAEPGARLLVTVRGHFEERSRPDGNGTAEILIVDRFERVWLGERCPPARRFDASLRDTYWKLVRAYDRTIAAAPGAPEAHLVLASEVTRAHGNLGCNRFSASYAHEDTFLRFTAVAATRMACPEGMDTEAAFSRVLEEANSYKIDGETLYLYADGEMIARLVAVRLP